MSKGRPNDTARYRRVGTPGPGQSGASWQLSAELRRSTPLLRAAGVDADPIVDHY
jgi:hypothetical protein